MKNYIYSLIFFTLINNSFGMNQPNCTAVISRQEALIRAQEQARIAHLAVVYSEMKTNQYRIIEAVIQDKEALKQYDVIRTLLTLETEVLQNTIVNNWLPEFTPTFIAKSTDEKFLEVIHQNKDIFEMKEFQERFFALPKEKILDFAARPENKELLDTIAKNAPEKVFKYLYNIGNKDFIESKSAIERKAQEQQKSSALQSIAKPFITIKNVSVESLDAFISYFYGRKNVSLETENEIREIAKETWSNPNFTVKQIDPNRIGFKTEEKALTIFNCLFINESYFKSLSETQKKALITHELGHINSGHSNKRFFYFGADLAISGINLGVAAIHAKQFFSEKSSWHKLTLLNSQIASWRIGFGIKHLLDREIAKNSYNQEFEADRYATLRIGNDDFAQYLESSTDQQALNISTDTHPSVQSRIEQIKTISQKSYIANEPIIETTTIIHLPKGNTTDIAKAIGEMIIAPYKVSLDKHQPCRDVSTIAFLGAAPIFIAPIPPVGAVVIGSVALVGTTIAVVKTAQFTYKNAPIAYNIISEYLKGGTHKKGQNNKKPSKKPQLTQNNGGKPPKGPKKPKDKSDKSKRNINDKKPRYEEKIDRAKFEKETLGKIIKDSFIKKVINGQKVYVITEKIYHEILKRGDRLYLDLLHENHIEVFNSTGLFKAVLNPDGTLNPILTAKAMKRLFKY